MKLTDQVVGQIKRQAGKIDQLRYGEIVVKVQDGKVVLLDMKQSIRVGADSISERS